MKIELTSKEYKTLVKLLFLGNMVINANRNSPDEWDKEVENLIEKIYSNHKDFNVNDFIVYIKEMERHYVNGKNELEYLNILDEFVDEYYEIQHS